MIFRRALAALLLFGGVTSAQTPVIRVDDAGPGTGPAILAQVLARPHVIVAPAAQRFLITRQSENRQTIVVLGRDAVVEGRVQGDVVVIAGNLYMHPGGAIAGRAVAIGGGVYESSLATVGGPVSAFRDFTYDIDQSPNGYTLRYRALVSPPEPGFALPGIFGLTLPQYDRSDGLAIGLAPRLTFHGVPLVVAPSLVYRSQLGAFDPGVEAAYDLGRRTRAELRVERGTLSNDRWIRSDLINSAVFLVNGNDTRNYYRASWGDLRLNKDWESVDGTLTPYVGLRFEDASSVRPGLAATGGPWTLLERGDEERDDRLRPNPLIADGPTFSLIAGARWDWSRSGVAAHVRLDGEAGAFSESCGSCDLVTGSDFGQLTFDGQVSFPTFKTQSVSIHLHSVMTRGGNTPPQRFAYIGGAGTLPTLDLLSEGGDQLFYFAAGYHVPIGLIKVPFAGSPVITLREVLGGAAIGRFPTIHQNLGLRASLGPVYGEGMLDPVTHHTHGSFGLSLAF